jgi:molybdopterin synthase sulfur carrier subunit
VKILYFAWVRQKVGRSEEIVEPPANVNTAGALIAWLAARGGGYADALGDPKRIRVAINQDHVSFNEPVAANDEVALFPPVTGG